MRTFQEQEAPSTSSDDLSVRDLINEGQVILVRETVMQQTNGTESLVIDYSLAMAWYFVLWFSCSKGV